jgi:hypothetical protein
LPTHAEKGQQRRLRFADERLHGHGASWHLLASVGIAIGNNLNLMLEGDFKRVVAQNCTLENHNEDCEITGG